MTNSECRIGCTSKFALLRSQFLNAYHNRAISTMEVIEELIKLAKEMEAATKRGEDLGLTDDEVAFYDALAVNESAVKAMGDDKLKLNAAEHFEKGKRQNRLTQEHTSTRFHPQLRLTSAARSIGSN
jgi:type I site-specific restriction-modification system R (restriction) subunit